MSWGEEQQKEIETIRERKITVKLSDADCDRLARKCGEHGLTIGELIENFVGDLVGGTYSNGSDERGLCGHHEPCRIPHKPCSIGVLCRAYKGGNPYQSSFTADTGTYRLCADKVVCKRVYEVERILLN